MVAYKGAERWAVHFVEQANFSFLMSPAGASLAGPKNRSRPGEETQGKPRLLLLLQPLLGIVTPHARGSGREKVEKNLS